MLKAKDIMTREVISVTPDTRIEELARLFMEKGVNAMPVVTEGDKLFGIVTETDLVAQDRPLHIPTVINIFDWVIYLQSQKDFAEEVAKITAQTVEQICAQDVVSCDPETPVPQIAQLMTENQAHLIPVVEQGRVVGVVARLDIIRAMGK
ncbi:CBS domain-containing protein [Geoalkalibacter halelectricus]|uniref:CBS domain-containing protein n=1 Tax=Geoalkalibacter halelectricus TaxID=2847045 RepID=A0ABY5ZMF9_9BACT|nr:CBS domain-containing protein [Geoalkalibacter halelectricus]MDO3379130.1 CBS domain-containing protein [Geoalkalibacter halelectricus]UWZ79015.1 CBS domain-containing protein [Geoalkalibacter halelectricus]